MARRQLFATFTGLLISIASMADSARAETDPPHLEEAEFALPGGLRRHYAESYNAQQHPLRDLLPTPRHHPRQRAPERCRGGLLAARHVGPLS